MTKDELIKAFLENATYAERMKNIFIKNCENLPYRESDWHTGNAMAMERWGQEKAWKEAAELLREID